MSTSTERELAEDVVGFILNTLNLAQAPEIPARLAEIESLEVVRAQLVSIRDFLRAFAEGDLSQDVSFKGYVAGALKTLQATLRHITWQTKMVASGDLTQRVEFAGEFSQSFNAMVTRLDETLTELTLKETELREANDALRRLATTDPLTGLSNRRHFFERAEAEVARSIRYSRPFAIVMFDIDHFKRVNDTRGHAGGDAVLVMIADVLLRMVRGIDLSARYGGEEFIVLMPETDLAEAAAAAERLRSRIESTQVTQLQPPIGVTASFGVSSCSGEHCDGPVDTVLAQLIETADQALYASKETGRNRVTIR